VPRQSEVSTEASAAYLGYGQGGGRRNTHRAQPHMKNGSIAAPIFFLSD
jgi:hypothetical protein